MLTGRGWWTLFATVLMLLVGIAAYSTPLIVTGLASLLIGGVSVGTGISSEVKAAANRSSIPSKTKITWPMIDLRTGRRD